MLLFPKKYREEYGEELQVVVVLVALMGILVLLGLATGLPRWSLPYVGFAFSLLSVYWFPQWLDRWDVVPFQYLYARSWIWGQIAYQGYLWGGLIVLAILLVILIILLPPLRRFKNDWTLLTFLQYGAIPFAVVLTFDDYVNDELFTLVTFIILVFGMWFNLHTDDCRRQFWALFGGMTVSLLFAAASKAIIYQYFWDGIRHFTWWTEMMSTVIMWMWISLSMLLPSLLGLNVKTEKSLQTD